MTAKERVVAAFEFRKPDRLPRYEMFIDEFIPNWRKEKDLTESVNIYNYYEKVDIGDIFQPMVGPFCRQERIERRDGNVYWERDDWGRLLKKRENTYFSEEIEVAIDEKDKLSKFEFESPCLNERYIHTEKNLAYRKKRFALVSGVIGLYMSCSRLRGQLQFLMDMAKDIPFSRDIGWRVMNFIRELGLCTLEKSDTWDTAIWVYDELASASRPIISPSTFAKIFLPLYKEMISFWKSKGAKNVVLHCDGNSLSLLDLLIEAGFTGIQSLAPRAGMPLPEVKRKYGNRLVLIGGMDNIFTLQKGSRQEIKNQVESIVEVAKEGGVVIGTHSVDGDIPVENYDSYYSILNECDEKW
jgi:uroporphyrinogen decarboxylase